MSPKEIRGATLRSANGFSKFVWELVPQRAHF
jgi:hypothetical protein